MSYAVTSTPRARIAAENAEPTSPNPMKPTVMDMLSTLYSICWERHGASASLTPPGQRAARHWRDTPSAAPGLVIRDLRCSIVPGVEREREHRRGYSRQPRKESTGRPCSRADR